VKSTIGGRQKRDKVFVIGRILFDNGTTEPAHVLEKTASIEGYFFKEVTSAFDNPYDSRRIGAFRVRKLNKTKEFIKFSDIAGKFVLTHLDLNMPADPLNPAGSLGQTWIAMRQQHA
jgi:hypothetical protein